MNGAKKVLDNPGIDSIDPIVDSGINRADLKITTDIKTRLKKISKIINEIKKLK